jgi:hypothetical protein
MSHAADASIAILRLRSADLRYCRCTYDPIVQLRRKRFHRPETVRDLLAGSGLTFEERGEFELKGLEHRRGLAALVR